MSARFIQNQLEFLIKRYLATRSVGGDPLVTLVRDSRAGMVSGVTLGGRFPTFKEEHIQKTLSDPERICEELLKVFAQERTKGSERTRHQCLTGKRTHGRSIS